MRWQPGKPDAKLVAMPSPNDPLDATEMATLFRRIIIAVYELNLLLRAASMGGNAVSVDTVERGDVTEIVVNGIPQEEL